MYSRHGLINRFYAVSHCKFIHQFLAGLVEVNLPSVVSFCPGQIDHSAVVLAEGMEKVLMKAGVLNMIWSHLSDRINQFGYWFY